MERFMERLFGFFEKHPEKMFIAKVVALAAVVYVLREIFFVNYLVFLFFFGFFPVTFIYLIALKEQKTFKDVLLQNLTFISVPYSDSERKNQVPVVTYILILLNVYIYFAVQPFLSVALFKNLLFVPCDPNWFNTLIASITSVFMHGSTGHLWGNMIFLWVFGATVEKRIGPRDYLVLYLVFGYFAGMASALGDVLFRDFFMPGLGASGAISGMMGVYAVRCYFRKMILPFPLFGLFSYFLPFSAYYKIRVNALYLISLYFISDLHGGFMDVMGSNYYGIGYWAHIGGFVSAVVISFGFGYHLAAREEIDTETAYDSLRESEIGTEEGEAALRRHIERNPEDSEACLMLARILTKYRLESEGIDAYTRTIRLMLKENPLLAAETFREYYHRHLVPLPDSGLMYRVAGALFQVRDFDFSARVLELVIAGADENVTLKERAIRQLVKLYRKLGHDHAIPAYEKMLVEL